MKTVRIKLIATLMPLCLVGVNLVWPQLIATAIATSLLDSADYTLVYPDPSGRNDLPAPAVWSTFAQGNVAQMPVEGLNLGMSEVVLAAEGALLNDFLCPGITSPPPPSPAAGYRVFLPLVLHGMTGGASMSWSHQAQTLLPGPGTLAPPLDLSVATDFAAATAFLYSGDNPIQTGVVSGTISSRCVAVVRGNVTTRDGQPLPGVILTILNHPEYGQTLSRADGAFDMAVNGGRQLVVVYDKEGYLPVQRTIQLPWRQFVTVEPVVMIGLDTQVTSIDLTSTADFQVARGSAIADLDGQRQATLLFPRGVNAVMRLANGQTMQLQTMQVRATEYTVGGNGMAAMPGNLPPYSGYTYAVEFSVDEALTVGATRVDFDKPVINYTENFIGAPVGSPVPVGYYDRQRGQWIASQNGRVIKIIAETGGLAEVDVTGDGLADTGESLTALGLTDAERASLASLYNPGQELWRVEITHFTPWDCNWPYGPPPGARPPQLKWFNNEEPDPCFTSGSIIGCESQTLGEAVPLTGVPFSLVYRSDRVPGWKVGGTLDIPVTGATLPPSLKGVRLLINVAGREFEYRWEDPTSPISSTTDLPLLTPNITQRFEWDGLDAYGRPIQGRPNATIRLMYIYDPFYYQASDDFEESFNQLGDNVEIFDGRLSCRDVGTRFFCGIPIQQTVSRALGSWDAAAVDGLGGWTLSVHHAFDPNEMVLHRGDGTQQRGTTFGIMATVAGDGQPCFGYLQNCGNGGPATQAQVGLPYGITVGPDGSLYIADYNANMIRQVGPDGRITTIAGDGEECTSPTAPCGDGGPATLAQLTGPFDVALGPDGSVYIADHHNFRIRRVGPDGLITTVAGNGLLCHYASYFSDFCGDGGPATQARLAGPLSIVIGPDGSLYICDITARRIRRVAPDGTITTVAGGGSYHPDLGDGGPATQAYLNGLWGVAVGPDGSLYIPDGGNSRVRRVGTDGIITTVAGGGTKGVDVPATEARLNYPWTVTVDADGSLYIIDANRIYRVGPEGILTLLAGSGDYGSEGDNGPAPLAQLNYPHDLAVGPDGSIYIADSKNYRVRRVRVGSSWGGGVFEIPDADTGELYLFDAFGRHLRTVDSLTGATHYQFFYDAANRLSAVTDAYSNTTRIERAADGTPTAIVAPGGQRTALSLGGAGYLAAVANPAGETTTLTYDSGGLLTTLTDPRGGLHQFSYDAMGRLTRDENPDGQVKTLTRLQASGGVTVTVRTSLGRETVYTSHVLPSQARLRTVRDPGGAITSLLLEPDGTRVRTEPGGTRTTITLGPDPRWGMLVPVPTSILIETPGGLRRETTITRTARLADPTNRFSLQVLTETVTTNGRAHITLYDAQNRTISREGAAGRRSLTTLDPNGRVTSIQPADGLLPITFTYDNAGRVNRVQQGEHAISYTYDAANRLISSADARGATVQYAYDDADRLIDLTLPGGSSYQFTYDASGNRTAVIMPSGAQYLLNYTGTNLDAGYAPPGNGALTKTYNLDGDFSGQMLSSGRVVTVTYQADGRPAGEIYDEASIAFAYADLTGRPNLIDYTPAEGGVGQQLGLTWDGALLTEAVFSGIVAGTYAYTYDDNFFLTGMELQSGANTIHIPLARDMEGLLAAYGPFNITRNGPGGAQSAIGDGTLNMSLTYDQLAQSTGRAYTVNGQPLYASQLTYDRAGRLIQKVETVAGTTATFAYTYDLDGQLIKVQRNGSQVESYDYDVNGNRTSRQINATPSITADYDVQDRLIQQGNVVYEYNADGQLIRRATDTFRYGARGELLEVTVNGQTITYGYDGLRRRTSRTDGSGTYRYFYGNPGNPFWITAMRDPAGQLTSYYYDDEGLLFAFQRDAQRYYVATDQVGTPRLVINGSGAIVKRLEYDAFGVPVSDSDPAFDLPIGFAGGLADASTGLVHFGFRDYDPLAGRWTRRDPARYQGGQTNLYVYMENNPIQLRDPLGLGFGIGASLYTGVGFEAEINISGEGISSCFGVGVGVGSSLGINTSGPKKRTGIYTSGEITGKYGPIGVSTGFEVDPCGELTQNPGKLEIGPLSINEEGTVGESLNPENYTKEASGSTELKLEGSLSGKYCATTLD